MCLVATAGPRYADGDIAPLGAPDGRLTLGDYLLTSRLVLGELPVGEAELAHADVYPSDDPDGVINLQDLLLLQSRVMAQPLRLLPTLDVYNDGVASVTLEFEGQPETTALVHNGYIGPGAVVVNNPNAADPDVAGNTIWHVSISGGIANAYVGTADLAGHPFFDSGFDLSGNGEGFLVFDLRVNSWSSGAVLTVKIDSGYPALGQVALPRSAIVTGQWRRFAISFDDLLADPGPGPGLDLANVVNAFVIEVTGGSADFYLDNIFVANHCNPGEGCRATIKTKVDPDTEPAADTDGDGVSDENDLCPGTPPDTIVDSNGCAVLTPEIEVAVLDGRLVGGPGSALPGFTLYVFDNDPVGGGSNCNGSCAANWAPLLVTDGIPTGAAGLTTLQREDGSMQVAIGGRPLYFFIGDTAQGDTNGDGAGGVWWLVPYTQLYDPLYHDSTVLEPVLQLDTPTALITRMADRARDRHAREDQFGIYDHYLSHYWEHRTAMIEIVDTVGKGGDSITFNVRTEWKLSTIEAELRFFYRGIGTVAEYFDNGVMTPVPSLDVPGEDARHYTRTVSFNSKEGRALQVGDRMEFELSQFLDAVPRGRNAYYGTTFLYMVGQGIVPWEARGVFGDYSTEREDSYPIAEAGWIGGDTTLPYQYSGEPDKHFMQMATNLSDINGQNFVLGRRVHHTDFGDGSHNEAVTNPAFDELAGLLGTHYVNRSCVSCHEKNGRALPPAVGQALDRYVVRIGTAGGEADPARGAVLQPLTTGGASEGGVTLASWSESGGLRTPVPAFSGGAPEAWSLRIAPQLVGMGLLEAINEADIEALADPGDANGDGISGRLHLVTDPETGQSRVGRFGWKASQAALRHQVAAALNTDMGVMTSIFPAPDCGSAQTGCGPAGTELVDLYVDQLTRYVALLGVRARRDLDDAEALQGEALFAASGCAACHVDTFTTSAHHPHAELRGQEIHPYTDLLLHDMGPGLASSLGEGDATGSEWRTAPLWGIGLTAGVSGGEAYLHDGRARTLTEAILWHGGEADASRQAFEALSQSEQDALIAFLRSL